MAEEVDPHVILTTPLRSILRTMLNSTEPVYAYQMATEHDITWDTASSCLQRLEKAGWVKGEREQEGSRPRRLYELTPEGRGIATERLASRRRGRSRSDVITQESLGL